MSINQTCVQHSTLIIKFKAFYANCRQLAVDDMDQIYHESVVFKDPIHEIKGLTSLHSYLSDMCKAITECRFEYIDEVVTHSNAYIKWNMHYRHPKLGNQLLILRGITHLQFSDKVIYHEDVYDLGQMIYEQVPLLGRVIKGLKNRLKHH